MGAGHTGLLHGWSAAAWPCVLSAACTKWSGSVLPLQTWRDCMQICACLPACCLPCSQRQRWMWLCFVSISCTAWAPVPLVHTLTHWSHPTHPHAELLCAVAARDLCRDRADRCATESGCKVSASLLLLAHCALPACHGCSPGLLYGHPPSVHQPPHCQASVLSVCVPTFRGAGLEKSNSTWIKLIILSVLAGCYLRCVCVQMGVGVCPPWLCMQT